MTRTSIREYTKAVRGRYLRASKVEKGKILDEFTKVIGCHRKAAIRLLHRGNQPMSNKKRGRPWQYGATVARVLRVVWETTDRLCSKRLHPFLPELTKVLRRHGDSTMNTEIEAQLCRMSPATIDRLLHPWRRLGGHLSNHAIYSGCCQRLVRVCWSMGKRTGASSNLPRLEPGLAPE